MQTEKIIKPTAGWIGVLMVILSLGLGIGGLILEFIPSLLLIALAIFLSIGFVIVAPNESCVLVFFGRYVGTIKGNGFYWVNPLNLKRKISLRARSPLYMPRNWGTIIWDSSNTSR